MKEKSLFLLLLYAATVYCDDPGGESSVNSSTTPTASLPEPTNDTILDTIPAKILENIKFKFVDGHLECVNCGEDEALQKAVDKYLAEVLKRNPLYAPPTPIIEDEYDFANYTKATNASNNATVNLPINYTDDRIFTLIGGITGSSGPATLKMTSTSTGPSTVTQRNRLPTAANPAVPQQTTTISNGISAGSTSTETGTTVSTQSATMTSSSHGSTAKLTTSLTSSSTNISSNSVSTPLPVTTTESMTSSSNQPSLSSSTRIPPELTTISTTASIVNGSKEGSPSTDKSSSDLNPTPTQKISSSASTTSTPSGQLTSAVTSEQMGTNVIGAKLKFDCKDCDESTTVTPISASKMTSSMLTTLLSGVKSTTKSSSTSDSSSTMRTTSEVDKMRASESSSTLTPMMTSSGSTEDKGRSSMGISTGSITIRGEQSTTETASKTTGHSDKSTPHLNTVAIPSTIPSSVSTSAKNASSTTIPITTARNGSMVTGKTTVETPVVMTQKTTSSPRTTTSVLMSTTRDSLVPDCDVACPDEFYEGDTFCMQITPPEYSRSYSDALTYCQRSDHLDMMDGREIQQNLESLNDMVENGLLPSDLVYLNEHGSAFVRKNRTIRVADLNATTRFTIGVAKRLGMSAKNDGFIGVCRITKSCQVASCDLSIFKDTGVPSLTLPSFSSPPKEGSSFHAKCPPGPNNKGEGRSFKFECSTRGHIEPHPSVVTCEYKVDEPPAWEVESMTNPRYQPDCEYCHPLGSLNCTMVEGKGAQCRCREGWRMFSCWLSPDFCKERNCSGNGRCLNKIDHGFCECKGGFAGEDCQINKTAISWNDPNKAQIFTSTTIATATLAGASLLMFILKLVSCTRVSHVTVADTNHYTTGEVLQMIKVVIIGEGEDPQETFQEIRSMLISVGSIAVLLFKHPDLFKVDPVGCRFYFWCTSMCYTVGQLFWAQEAINAKSCCLARNRNEWDIDFEGNKRRRYDYLYRVAPTYLLGGLYVMGVCFAGWDHVPSKWTCLGVFSEMTSNVWMPLVIFNGLAALTTATVGEYAARVHVYRPHYKVMTHHFLEVYDPFTRERVDKVYRNLPFIIIGPFFHFLTWFFIAISADQSSALYNGLATLFTYTYTVHNIIQSIVTTPAIWYKLTCLMMTWAPPSYQPASEKLFLWTRDEVVNRKDPNWITKLKKKEEQDKKEMGDKETKEWNEKVIREFPTAPAWLFRKPKEEGPTPILPPPPSFAPCHAEYISMKRQQRIISRWNRDYLEERLETRMPPDVCAYEVLKKEMNAGMLDGTEEEDSQMRSIWARFHLYVPSADNLDMGKRVDRDKVRAALESFDFDPSSCEEIRTLEQMQLDHFDAPQVHKFIKMPHPKMDYQIAGFDEAYGEYLDETNEPYDRIYDDDEFVLLAMVGLTEAEKEGVRRTLNIIPGIVENGAKSRNPRKKDLDSIWLDEENIGFIGPSRSATAPFDPIHGEMVTKQRHYAKMADGQWEFMERAANRIKESRQLRKSYRGKLKK